MRFNIRFKRWRHSQVVRQRSAKPLFPSSNLGGASKSESLKALYQGFEGFFIHEETIVIIMSKIIILCNDIEI